MKPTTLTDDQRDTLAHIARPLRSVGRSDTLTAQRVEVAIVLHAMLGDAAAAEYLHKHRVASHVVARIVHPSGRRRGAHNEHGVQVASSC